MPTIQKIIPCLWFDTEAEDAAKFYVGVFERNSRIKRISHYTEAGHEVHGKKAGTVLTVELELEGSSLTFLNGGPQFKFSEAMSLQVMCDTQAEIDCLWSKLSSSEKAEQCGWLKDKYGLSWQIVPATLKDLIADPDPVKAGRVMTALMGMKKLDLAALERAYRG